MSVGLTIISFLPPTADWPIITRAVMATANALEFVSDKLNKKQDTQEAIEIKVKNSQALRSYAAALGENPFTLEGWLGKCEC